MQKKHILIWGLGKTGQAFLQYLKKKNYIISAVDKSISQNLTKEIKKSSGTCYAEKEIDQAIAQCDVFIPSPGIKLPFHLQNHPKLLTEFDLFYNAWKKPVITITGSVGKTSTTSFLETLLSKKYTIACGGNIGIPLVNLIEKSADFSLIEASSAQLEYTKNFTSDYFIITNLYPNHLDRHITFKSYIEAKLKPLYNTSKTITFITHQETLQTIKEHYISIPSHHKIVTCSTTNTNSNYFLKNNSIYKNNEKVIDLSPVQHLSCIENWLLIGALLDKLNCTNISCNNLETPEHRLEYCGTSKENILFFNDSKSTIMESTLNALKTLKKQYPQKKITLIRGGLSKGVDQKKYLNEIKNFSSKIIDLKAYTNITCPEQVMSEALTNALKQTNSTDIILLSPGGSSFDYFKNFEERGKIFKKQLKPLIKS